MSTRFLACIVLAASSAACSGSLHELVADHAKGQGSTQLYAVTKARAWEIAHEVVRREGAGAIEDHEADGYFLTNIEPQTMKQNGARVGVWFAPSGPEHTNVTVLTELSGTLFMKGLTEGTFHHNFSALAAFAPADVPPAATPSSSPPAAPPSSVSTR